MKLLLTILLLTLVASSVAAQDGDAQNLQTGDEFFSTLVAAARSPQGPKRLIEVNKSHVTFELWERVINEGARLNDKSQYEQGLSLMEAARQIAERLDKPSLVAESIHQLGETYRLQGKPSVAIEVLLNSAKLLADSDAQTYLLYTLKDLSLAFIDKGDFSTARDYAQRTHSLAERLNDKGGAAWAYFLFGNIDFRSSKYDDALRHLAKSRTLLAGEVKNGALLADVLAIIASIQTHRGNNKEGFQLFQESLAIVRRLDQPKRISRFLRDIGVLYYHQGDFEAALNYFKQSLQIAEEIKDKRMISSTLYNMGCVANEQGRHQESVDYLLRVLPIKKELEDHDFVLMVEEELSAAYMDQGRYDLALEHLNRSLSASKGNTEYHQSVSLYYLGKLHLLKGDYAKAVEYLDKAATIGLEIGRFDLIYPPRVLKGRAYYLKKDYDQAMATLIQVIKMVELSRATIVGGEEEKALFFQVSIEAYHVMVEVMLAKNEPLEALLYAEQARARVLLDVMQSGKSDIAQFMTAEEQQIERRLNTELTALNIKISQENAKPNPSAATLAELNTGQEKARLDYEAFKMQLYAKHPDSRPKRTDSTLLSSSQLNAVVPDARTAFLEYVTTDEATTLFVLTKSSAGTLDLNTYRIAVKGNDLAAKIKEWRRLLTTRDQEYEEPARAMYDLLLGPAAKHLKGKTLVTIIPDAALWELPFQALLSPATNRYFIEDHALYYAPSLTIIYEMSKRLRARQSGADTDELLAVGNPARSTERISLDKYERLMPLPNAEREVKALTNLFDPKRSTVLIGAAAREKTIKSEAASYRILHFAAHAVLDNYRPSYSRILLASSTATDTEDGLLEATEIIGMHLNAELAVLSACQTALGQVGAGEGMLGMAWAFSVAGVPTTVASQWKVDSEGASDLMVNFYRELKRDTTPGAHNSKAEALRVAQLALLKSPRYRHPFYWGPWVMIGDGSSPTFN